MPGIPRADILRHAAAIVAEQPPPPEGWHRTGRAWPIARLVGELRKVVGWPLETVTIELPQLPPRSGTVTQPATVCPLSWLRLLAQRLGVPLTEVCRGVIADE